MKTIMNHGVNLLGYEVLDPISGIRGIIESRVTFMNNNVRYSVQPKSKDGMKLEAGFDIDEHQLKPVGKGVSHLRVNPPINLDIDLGMEAKDIVTGIKGILIEKHESLNGCVYFVLTAKMVNPKESPLQGKFTYERLVRVGKGVTDEVLDAQEKAFTLPKLAVKKKSAQRQGVGAPMTKTIRY